VLPMRAGRDDTPGPLRARARRGPDMTRTPVGTAGLSRPRGDDDRLEGSRR
jgi:hypothetical protein